MMMIIIIVITLNVDDVDDDYINNYQKKIEKL